MKRYLFLLIIVVFFQKVVHSQDFNNNPAGIRARSMGGAYLSLANDPSAIYWNPAGLCGNERIEFSSSNDFNYQSMDSDVPNFDTKPYRFNHAEPCSFWAIHLCAPKYIKNFHIAFGRYKIFDFESEFNRSDYLKKQTGGIFTKSLAVSYQAVSNFSFGLSLNFMDGDRVFDFDNKNSNYAFYGEDSKSQYSYKGFNATFGIQFVFRKFKAGLTCRNRYRLQEKNLDTGYYGDIKLPEILTFGLSFEPDKALITGLDIEWRRSSIFKWRFWDDSGLNEVKDYFKNTVQFRLGSEYTWKIGKFHVPFRSGVATVPLMNKGTDDHRIIGTLLSFGSGIKYSMSFLTMYLDFGFLWNRVTYNKFGENEMLKNYYCEKNTQFILGGGFIFNTLFQ